MEIVFLHPGYRGPQRMCSSRCLGSTIPCFKPDPLVSERPPISAPQLPAAKLISTQQDAFSHAFGPRSPTRPQIMPEPNRVSRRKGRRQDSRKTRRRLKDSKDVQRLEGSSTTRRRFNDSKEVQQALGAWLALALDNHPQYNISHKPNLLPEGKADVTMRSVQRLSPRRESSVITCMCE